VVVVVYLEVLGVQRGWGRRSEGPFRGQVTESSSKMIQSWLSARDNLHFSSNVVNKCCVPFWALAAFFQYEMLHSRKAIVSGTSTCLGDRTESEIDTGDLFRCRLLLHVAGCQGA
jgi:hypothetical protein